MVSGDISRLRISTFSFPRAALCAVSRATQTVVTFKPDEELDLDYCKEAVQMDVPYALSNSLGFGGHNASILLKKYSE